MIYRGKQIGLTCFVWALSLFIVACPGGRNDNRQSTGPQTGGVDIKAGNIAVAPTGNYLLFRRNDSLLVGYPETGRVQKLPVEQPTRLAFSKRRNVVYVGSNGWKKGADGQKQTALSAKDKIVAMNIDTGQRLWSTGIVEATNQFLRLAVSNDGRYLLAASGDDIHVIDAQNGRKRKSYSLDNFAVDARILDDNRRAIVVEFHRWQEGSPKTKVSVIDLETGRRRTLSVPNCASKLALDHTNDYAFMAPTKCEKDPISVIDLEPESEKFERNLPGFGPVAIGPKGYRAIGFVDMQNVDYSLFEDPNKIPEADKDDSRFYLMIINTRQFDFTLHPVGDHLPRYTITDDGKIVLVDSTQAPNRGTRLFDLETKMLENIEGPTVTLDHFTLTSDSRHAYGLSPRRDVQTNPISLFHIDLVERSSEWIQTNFTPRSLNISAGEQRLFIRRDDDRICVFSLETRACEKHLELTSDIND